MKACIFAPMSARGVGKSWRRSLRKKDYGNIVGKMTAALQPCPFLGVVTADQVKIALGECLDIWPDLIAPDCVSHGKP